MKSIQAQISEAVIRRHADKPVRQISDTRHPLKFRYRQERTKGSWYVVSYSKGKASWRKVGAYPTLSAAGMIKALPGIMQRLAADPHSESAVIGQFETTFQLLEWYRERCFSARYLSDARRKAIKCIVNVHLIPKVGFFRIAELDHASVDRLLFEKMQDYSVAYMRQVFDLLRLAFKQAAKLKMIDLNPIGGLKFSDFVSATIKPRQGRLKRNKLPDLFTRLSDRDYEAQTLALLMLMNGTRIGETRMMRWDHIDWGDKTLEIPERNTKTREAHRIPLTLVALALLKRHRQRQEYHGYKGVYLFPDNKGHELSASAASELIRAASGGQWSAHDLRKMARTCWADLGIDYMVSERLLNHKMTNLDQAYIHTYVEDQKRTALEKYHNWLKPLGLDALLSDR